MEIISVGSSSSGNCYIVKTETANILFDVGLSAAKIVRALNDCGLACEDVDAVLITHEHIDHVRSVRAISKKCENAVFYASRGTVCGCANFEYVPDDRLVTVQSGDRLEIDGVMIDCFGLSHDANEPVGYSITADGSRLTVVTDTGVITDEIYSHMKASDVLVFEANHDEHLLMMGDYPYNVKMRIKSDHGHLSNIYAAETLARLMDEREDAAELTVMLAHLSEKNNMPFEARACIEEIMQAHGYEQGRHYYLTIAAKEGLTFI